MTKEVNEEANIEYIKDLLLKYSNNQICASEFCDKFYYEYDLKTAFLISVKNKKLLNVLSVIAGRFSEFEEDFINYPNVYYNETDLKETINKTLNLL